MGILINTGFDVGSSSPIDSRTVKNTTDERDALVSDGLVYENLKVYCKDTKTEYRWTGTEWEEVGTGGSSSGTDISMTDYYTKTEVDNDFLKKTDAASTYATKTELNEKANDSEVVKKADITDLENRVTTNEANITDLQEQTSDLQEQIDNLDIPEITNVLNNNSTINQVPNAKLVANEIYGKSISLSDYSDILKIPTGIWRVDSNEKARLMKNLPVSAAGILEVKYLHGKDSTTIYTSPYKYSMLTYTVITGDIYVRALSSIIATDGSITNGDTGWRKNINGNSSELTDMNTKLTQLETKANLIPVVADNPTDYDLNNYTENGNYSIGKSSDYANTPEASAGLLTVMRANTYRLQIYTVINNDNVYFRKSTDWGITWTSWVLLNGSSSASGNGTNNDVYSTEEQAVGTWINGKTLYRRTIEDNTLRETGTDMIKLFAYNTNMKIVKFEGVVTLANDNGQTFIRSLPYSKDGDEVYVTKTTLDTLRLDSYLTNYKLGGYIVSVYYYKV